MRKDKGKLAATQEITYLILLAVIGLMAFNYTTMSGVEFPEWLRHLVLLAAALTALARIIFDRGCSWPGLLLGALLAGLFFVVRSRSMQGYLLELAALILGAQGIRFKKIVKVYFAVSLAALLVTMGLALGGVIENLVYERAGRTRMSFGIAYPTDFCAHVFFLTCCWAWIRGRRIGWAEIALIAALALFCLVFCDARNGAACLLLLAAGLSYVKLRRSAAARKGGDYRMNRVVSGILCGSMPLCAALMIGLSLLYNGSSSGMVTLDLLLSGRLELGRRAFDAYPVTFFGQFVEMTGLGNSLTHTGEYFWLDSSYVNILLRLGILALLSVLAVFVYASTRERKNGAWERLFILAVIALQCMIEHHLIEIGHHPFLLLMLAVSGAGGARGKSSDGQALPEQRGTAP